VQFTKRAALGAVLAGSLALSACGGGGGKSGGDTLDRDDVTGVINGTLNDDGPARDGGAMTVYDTADSPSLDISAASFNIHSQLSGLVYNKLLRYDTGRDIKYGAQQLEGDLAESWDVSEDGLTWTFKLRKGVKFQNVAPVSGREFTAADVVCTIDHINTTPGAVQAGLMSIVSKVDTPDDYTAVFTLKSPFAAFDQSVASYNMEIIPCEAARGEFDMKEVAIGTGPFILDTWDKKISKTYVKNPDYFEPGKPHLDKLTILVMPDQAAQIAAYRTKQLDILSPTDQQLDSVLGTNGDSLVRTQTQLTMTQVMMNQTAKPFDDVRVRKAVAMSWDRKGMGDTFYYDYTLGSAYPATLLGGMTAEESDEAWPYDPEGAKKLLAEAGFPNGLDVELTVTDGYGATIVNQAQWFQQDLEKVGIHATIKQLDYATYAANVLTNKAAYTIAYGYSSGLASPDEWLTSFYKSGSTRNSFGTADPKLDQMIDEQRGILDTDERAAKLHEIAEYIAENVVSPVLGMQAAAISFVQPWVHNVYSAPAYERPYLADAWIDESAPNANAK